MSIKITKDYIPRGTNARPGWTLDPQYITIHETANTSKGAGAHNHMLFQTRNGGQNNYVSYHFVVDDHECYQLLPLSEISWHAGDGTNGLGNRRSISIEVCVNPDSNRKQTWNRVIDLVADLMEQYKIDINHVVQHNHWSGKDCPHYMRKGQPYPWSTFKSRVLAKLYIDKSPKANKDKNLYHVQVGAYKDQENAKKMAQKLEKDNYQVYVPLEDGLYRVQVGAFKEKSNATKLANELKRKGYQVFVTRTSPKPKAKPKAKPKPNRLTDKEVARYAKQVAIGAYGNEPKRTKRLKAKGLTDEDIKRIQKKVNQMFRK